MNATPETSGTDPARRPLKPLTAWGLFAAAVFVILAVAGFVLESASPPSTNLLLAAAVSLALTIVAAVLTLLLRWIRHWENLSRLLFGVAGLATLIALAYAVENWRGRTSWLKHRQALEAKGEPFELRMLVPPRVPDDQNFAMLPLLAPALNVTNTPEGLVWGDTNGLNRLNDISAEIRPGRHENDRLVLGSLEKGTVADLQACAEFYRGNTNYPQAAPGASAAERILVALGRFEPELQELQKAAVERPYGRFPVQYETEPSWAILLPHLARVKSLAQLANLRAIAFLEAGKPAEALADLKLVLRLSDSIREEPILISHLVRIAILNFALQTVREGLVRHAWTETQLEELQQRLQSIDLFAEYKHSMRGERAFSVEGLDYLRRNGAKNLPGDDLPAAKWMFLFPSGWMYQNMLHMSRLHQEYTLSAVDERADRVHPEVLERGVQAVEDMRRGPYTHFARLLLPAVNKVALKPAQAQTYLDAARLACALERFRLAEGKLPSTLEALVPRFLSALPRDVIDGNPLRYKLGSDATYTLYSVGWNGTDEGGLVALKKEVRDLRAESSQSESAKGDWVWRLL